MSAQSIYDLVPLGSTLTYSDSSLRPPERFAKKLAAWENRNSGGRLIRKQAAALVGNTTIPASITLHEGDYGSQGTIVMRVHRTFSVNSELRFAVEERSAIGSVLVFDRANDDAELVHLTRQSRRRSRMAYPPRLSQCRPAGNHGRPGSGGQCRGEGSGMSAPAFEASVIETPDFPGTSFGKSADGLLVALVGEHAFAMAPARDGRHFLVTGWRIRRPMAQWTRDDFYGHNGDLADENAFRAKVLENAEHQREKIALGRREERSGANTPWGPSQGATVYADGVVFHSTAGHGGFLLSPDRNRKVHQSIRVTGGAYEEDEAWAIVAFSFPHLFTCFERRAAEKTMKDTFPDAWEVITGNLLGPGESWKRDERDFAEHRDDWIVISAIISDQQSGFTEVIATPGGKRGPGSEERRFLVPSDEYRVGRFGFVIDPERHAVYGGPSSFVSWQGRPA